MAPTKLLRLALALAAALPGVPPLAQGRRPEPPVPLLDLFAVTKDGFAQPTGELVRLEGNPLGSAQVLAATDGGLRLRAFGKFLYVVNEQAGTVTRVRRDGASARVYDLGAGSRPQDVLVQGGRTAWVTRHDETELVALDLASGEVVATVDLAPLAGEGEALTQRCLARDGRHLLVQVGLTVQAGPTQGADRGLLAVVDLVRRRLVDVDPAAPGVQGVALLGAPPRLPMQTVERVLLVSTTDGRLDERGGIERVDLDSLASLGFALTERQVGADLGGFVMTSPAGGYFVFHTDIVASTHLKSFTLAQGPAPGPELLVLLGDAVEVLVHDEARRRIYVPSGFAGFGLAPGIYALDTDTDELAGTGPIATPQAPHDLVLAR